MSESAAENLIETASIPEGKVSVENAIADMGKAATLAEWVYAGLRVETKDWSAELRKSSDVQLPKFALLENAVEQTGSILTEATEHKPATQKQSGSSVGISNSVHGDLDQTLSGVRDAKVMGLDGFRLNLTQENAATTKLVVESFGSFGATALKSVSVVEAETPVVEEVAVEPVVEEVVAEVQPEIVVAVVETPVAEEVAAEPVVEEVVAEVQPEIVVVPAETPVIEQVAVEEVVAEVQPEIVVAVLETPVVEEAGVEPVVEEVVAGVKPEIVVAVVETPVVEEVTAEPVVEEVVAEVQPEIVVVPVETPVAEEVAVEPVVEEVVAEVQPEIVVVPVETPTVEEVAVEPTVEEVVARVKPEIVVAVVETPVVEEVAVEEVVAEVQPEIVVASVEAPVIEEVAVEEVVAEVQPEVVVAPVQTAVVEEVAKPESDLNFGRLYFHDFDSAKAKIVIQSDFFTSFEDLVANADIYQDEASSVFELDNGSDFIILTQFAVGDISADMFVFEPAHQSSDADQVFVRQSPVVAEETVASDVFSFGLGSGRIYVTEFDMNKDKIFIKADLFSNFDEMISRIAIYQSESSAVLELHDSVDMIILPHFSIENISKEMFVFEASTVSDNEFMADIKFGTSENDTIIFGAGDQMIDPSLGFDVVTGGEGHDTFIFGANSGHDFLVDFKAGEDHIQIGSDLAQDFTDLMDRAAIYQDGSATQIEFAGGQLITLYSTDAKTASAEWFSFS